MKKVEIDNSRLAQAIADYSRAVSTTKSHRQNRFNSESQLQEIDGEIVRLQRLIKDLDFQDNIGLADIKKFAEQKLKFQTELGMLETAREGLGKRLRTDTSYSDVLDEIGAKQGCWRVLYDSLFKTLDVESLRELIAVGLKADIAKETTLTDLNLDADSIQLDALAKQFGIPL